MKISPNFLEIYISGSTGFIGTNLCKFLKKKKIKIHLLSRDHLTGSKKFELRKDSICIHLAGENDIKKINKDKNFVKESDQYLSLLHKKGFKKIIYISSAYVYDDKIKSAHSEDEKIKVKDNYSLLKINAEKILEENGHCILRVGNIYGNGMRKNIFIDVFNQIREPKVVLNSYSEIRDYVFIDDVITLIYKLLKCDYHGVFNVGTGVGTNVRQLVDKILTAFDLDTFPEIVFLREGRKSSLILDISKASSLLNWKPKYQLENGLKKVLI